MAAGAPLVGAVGGPVTYYDRDGQPIDMERWVRLMEDPGYKVIAKTVVGDAEVSTVWLGLDHSFGGSVPIIFETMIFGGALDENQWRYATEDEARQGHAEKVTLLQIAEAAG